MTPPTPYGPAGPFGCIVECDCILGRRRGVRYALPGWFSVVIGDYFAMGRMSDGARLRSVRMWTSYPQGRAPSRAVASVWLVNGDRLCARHYFSLGRSGGDEPP